MELGFVGLGRMGKNMVFRLLQGKHRIVAWNRSPEPVREVAAKGAVAASSLPDLVSKLTDPPRTVWVMVPAGDPTEQEISLFPAAAVSPICSGDPPGIQPSPHRFGEAHAVLLAILERVPLEVYGSR